MNMPALTESPIMEPQETDQASLCRVTVISHSPSPYQVELFDAVAKLRRIELTVIYLYARDKQRLWQSRSPCHHSLMLSESGVNRDMALQQTEAADLLVINYYKHPFAKFAMQRLAKSGGAMCFWGE